MSRRSASEIAADYKARAAKLDADHERRLSVASDVCCELLWDAEKAARAVAAYHNPGPDSLKYLQIADEFRTDREARWTKLKAIRPKDGA